MRCIHLIAVHENPEAMFATLTSLAFLNEAQTAQLDDLVEGYRDALQVVDDPDDVSVSGHEYQRIATLPEQRGDFRIS